MAKINISLPDEFLKEIDKLKGEENVSRSEFLREAVRTYGKMLEERKLEEKRRKNILESIRIQDSLRKKSGSWDGVKEIRKWRNKR
jgi:metal-responsive CopG/Arc/MetJ family transcriptional regulator